MQTGPSLLIQRECHRFCLQSIWPIITKSDIGAGGTLWLMPAGHCCDTQQHRSSGQNLFSVFRLHKQRLLCCWDRGRVQYFLGSREWWRAQRTVSFSPVLNPQRSGCVTTMPRVFFSAIPALPVFYLPFWAFLSTKLAFYRSNYNGSKIPFLPGNVEFGWFSLCTSLSTYQTLNFICHHWILISGVFCGSLQSGSGLALFNYFVSSTNLIFFLRTLFSSPFMNILNRYIPVFLGDLTRKLLSSHELRAALRALRCYHKRFVLFFNFWALHWLNHPYWYIP